MSRSLVSMTIPARIRAAVSRIPLPPLQDEAERLRMERLRQEHREMVAQTVQSMLRACHREIEAEEETLG